MTVVLDMRDRIAAAAQQELRDRGLPSGADIAFAIADRALTGTQFEALTAYVGAVEAGADPTAARDLLSGDPVLNELIAP
ncbi:MAG: hypothetical protein K2X61_09480 [Caulobacteraceae bacterium]|nr:hypothetical protein [Caulobacteraceae bacterium]